MLFTQVRATVGWMEHLRVPVAPWAVWFPDQQHWKRVKNIQYGTFGRPRYSIQISSWWVHSMYWPTSLKRRLYRFYYSDFKAPSLAFSRSLGIRMEENAQYSEDYMRLQGIQEVRTRSRNYQVHALPPKLWLFTDCSWRGELSVPVVWEAQKSLPGGLQPHPILMLEKNNTFPLGTT